MMTTTKIASVILGGWSIYGTGHAVNGNEMMASTALDVRQLQTTSTYLYRATYQADFQHLRDFVCTAAAPILQVSCYGTAMNITNVSDPSIQCTMMDEPNVINGTSFQCVNTCTTTCAAVYEAFNSVSDGPFASIEFMCDGDNIQQVAAQYTYVSGIDGLCEFTSSGQSRNYHVGRLGVSCPSGTTGGREYVYDDTYAECSFGGSVSPGIAFDIPGGNAPDSYTCITGDSCDGAPCSVPFDEITFYSTLPNYFDSCVESSVNITAFPTPAPQDPSASSEDYIVLFEASWTEQFDSDQPGILCDSVNPTVSISCGADSIIQLVNATDSSIVCSSLSSGALSCTSYPSATVKNFSSVLYVSASVS